MLRKEKRARGRRRVSYSEEFQRFWEVYPRRVGKAAALKAWKQTQADRPPLEQLLQTVVAQSHWPAWTAEGGKYIPHPATWLNQHRWGDEPPRPQVPAELTGGGWQRTTAPGPGLDIEERLRALADRLPKEPPCLEQVRRAILDLDAQQTAEAIEAQLDELDHQALEQLWRALDDERKATLHQQVEATLHKLSQRLDREELVKAKGRLWRQLLRQACELPVLSLFS